jgi:hypothetical protein
MATNKKLWLSAILIQLLVCYAGCKECDNAHYAFSISNKIYPDKDSIHVGDSIWIEVDAPTHLVDQGTNAEVDYSGAQNLGTAIQFLKLGNGTVQIPNVQPAGASFKTDLLIGDSVPEPNPNYAKEIKNIRFREVNGRYLMKVAFIAKDTGNFMIAPSNSANVYRQNGGCTLADFAIPITDTDQHFYIYQETRPGYEITGLERTNCYYVRVKL